MAEGLPIIASDILPHREMLAECGIYFAPSDWEELGQLIATLGQDRSQLDEIGARSRQQAQLFTTDRIVENHIQLYRRLLGLGLA